MTATPAGRSSPFRRRRISLNSAVPEALVLMHRRYRHPRSYPASFGVKQGVTGRKSAEYNTINACAPRQCKPTQSHATDPAVPRLLIPLWRRNTLKTNPPVLLIALSASLSSAYDNHVSSIRASSLTYSPGRWFRRKAYHQRASEDRQTHRHRTEPQRQQHPAPRRRQGRARRLR